MHSCNYRGIGEHQDPSVVFFSQAFLIWMFTKSLRSKQRQIGCNYRLSLQVVTTPTTGIRTDTEARENAPTTQPILIILSWISSLFKTTSQFAFKAIFGQYNLLLDMGDAPTAIAPDPSTSSPSEWHTIRPWTPHLTLAVREITSVSATFILSSSLDVRHTTDDEPELELGGDTSNDIDNDATLDSRGIIADAMSHGLSVDVNGSNWQRVILRMNDHADEAIIVIYGLHPGRQYDIDLALVSGGTMRKQVTTEGQYTRVFSVVYAQRAM